MSDRICHECGKKNETAIHRLKALQMRYQLAKRCRIFPKDTRYGILP